MIKEWVEKDGNGRWHQFLTRLSAIWLVLTKSNFVALTCDVIENGEYHIEVKYLSIVTAAVPVVVGEWVDAATRGNGLVEEANRLLKGQ